MAPEKHIEHMRRAIALAKKSSPEDNLPRPLVGVLVVNSEGKEIGGAFRGELGDGEHAEFTALERKFSDETLAGATVYATLEPCTTRNHPKVPCAQRLIDRRVGRVVVGMLDPNPNILGRGVLQLRDAGIAVEFFPPDLMAELEELNREFRATHSRLLAPPLTDELLRRLADQGLDQWYLQLNRTYWNRNFQRSAAEIFAHLVEVIGNLSVLVSKKHNKDAREVQKYMAKAVAWWLALCGKVGVTSPESLLFGKFPSACPYCLAPVHSPEECRERKGANQGPDWAMLGRLASQNSQALPQRLREWQRMFAKIYPSNTTEDPSRIFAKLTEEVGELAEALRVFPVEPGYFLSESADVFAWLMKLNNTVEYDADVPIGERGDALERQLAESYPARCTDCNAALCTCPPILLSTIGRIAHEVSPERSRYGENGSFMTAEKVSARFGRDPL